MPEQPKTYANYPYIPSRALAPEDVLYLRETLPPSDFAAHLDVITERRADALEAGGLTRKGAERKAADEVQGVYRDLATYEQAKAQNEAETVAALATGQTPPEPLPAPEHPTPTPTTKEGGKK